MKTLIIHANELGVNVLRSRDVSQKDTYRILISALANIADTLTLDEIKEAVNA